MTGVLGGGRTAAATKTLPKTRSEVSAKLKLSQLSTLRSKHSSLIWTVATMETVERMFLSQRLLADTCVSALSSVLVIDMNWIAAWKPHQLVRLAIHWTSTSAYILPAWQILLNALLILARNHNRQHDSWFQEDSWMPSNRSIPGSDGIVGSRNTAASATKESSSHKGWGAWKTPAFSALHIAKETLLINLTLCEHGNCWENGSLTVVTAWHLHVCPLFSTGDRYEQDCCTNAPSIGKTGKTLN